MGTTTLADAVRAGQCHAKPGPRGFLERLEQSARDEILELRRQFQSGEFGTLSAMEVSRRVQDEASQRGWQLVGVKEFSLWLRR